MKNKTAKDKTTMTAREVAVLIEDLKSQFRIFGEDLSSVKARLDMLFEEQGRLKEEMFIVKADIRIIKNDIVTIKNDIAEIKETLIKGQDKRSIAHLKTVSPK